MLKILLGTTARWSFIRTCSATLAFLLTLTMPVPLFADANSAATRDAELPAEWKGREASPAVERLSATRERITLDGPWRFVPVTAGEASPRGPWGWMNVPGSWLRKEDVLARGSGPAWDAFGEGRALPAAWYERSFDVPQAWKGRAIILEFERVSTDAIVYVNDKEAGKVDWPEGQLDITELVTPGKPVTIRARVIATLNQKEVTRLMGTAPGQNFVEKAELRTAGLIGSVTATARPQSTHISDVFVRPSVRQKKIRLDIELAEVVKPGRVEIVAEMVNASGQVEKRFTQASDVVAAERQVISPAWDWPDPKLWDLGAPNLYTLRLTTTGSGLKDSVAVRFGFREFWIEGRDYYLNGSKFRARTSLFGGFQKGGAASMIDKLVARGFNLAEMWPNGTEERSVDLPEREAYTPADEKGFLVTGLTPHMDWMGNRVNTPEKLAAYAKTAERIMRRDRNHPSIVMWGTSGNMFGGVLDPKYVGIRAESEVARMKTSPKMAQPVRFAAAGVEALREIDPTRPIFIHHGGASGDVYTINHYLNFTPLQEREEWLSRYAEKGDMPLWYVEFGTPVAISLMRGRNGFQKANTSEPLLSEYCAMYLGREAYELEPEEYRKLLHTKHKSDQLYDLWWIFDKRMTFAPAWLKLQELFLTNTWRSWRTMGMTGGMIPWDRAYAELDGKQTIAGDALVANNGPSLAWIAGRPDAFTEKSHSFWAGTEVTKQVALLNDERAEQPYSVSWQVTIANAVVAKGADEGKLVVGETRMVPVRFKIPALSEKADGEVRMEATIGKRKHADRFAFRGFPVAQPIKGQVVVFDPVGKTSKLLTEMGITPRPWDGGNTNDLLIVGREAFSSKTALPGDLEAFVREGGRLLVMQQSADVLTTERGLRVAGIQSRRVFRVNANHPVVAGLDDIDLRDWAGSSTLLEPYPDYINDPKFSKPTPTNAPHYGWRWGTRGTVSSVAIEKPHRSAWRPLLECEFDLAYTPLMELDFGKGRVVWSQLDLEDHAAVDPAAALLARRVVQYASEAPLEPRLRTVYIGDDAGARLLDSAAVKFEKAEAIPEEPCVLILGNRAENAPDDARLREWVERGGRLLVLPRTSASAPLGVALKQRSLPNGSLALQGWSELRGMSVSDTRWRTAFDAWLIEAGAETAADGQVGRLKIGKGVALFCQFDPDRFDADKRTYFRLTRWRQTRALAQLLANVGAEFKHDAQIFHVLPTPAAPPELSMAGEWKAHFVKPLKSAPSAEDGYPDPGVSPEAKAALEKDFNDRGWASVRLPANNETLGKDWSDKDGESVFRKRFDVGPELLEKPTILELGTMDDNDEVYVNGQRIGGRGDADTANWSVIRSYPIPPTLLRATGNVVSVRVWDRYGGGGFTGKPENMRLHLPTIPEKTRAGLYHPDYRADFELGDDPYRYYNW